MSLFIYDTFSGEKSEFKPIDGNQVKMYVCGPTVYTDAHIGHALSAIVFDTIRRYLLHKGYDVKFAMNFTDVDDKIIAKTQGTDTKPEELTERLIEEFKSQLQALNVLPATLHPKATNEIDNIIDFIGKLIEKGAAYEKNGDALFKVSSFDKYGGLSKRKLEDQLAGTRVEVNEEKEYKEDFALWKSAKPGEPFWESPWGKGRPGWHIECSAMCMHHLGEQIDIHGGGNDLVFPHHENEIAQSEMLTGKKFANYWMHNGMLQLKGGKMSKSVGNIVSIKDFLSQFDGNTFRMLTVSSYYRSPLQYSEEIAQEASTKFQRIISALKPGWGNESDDTLDKAVEEAKEGFFKSMDADFNTPIALSHIFNLVKAINQSRDKGASTVSLQKAQDKLKFLMEILGFHLDGQSDEGTENNIEGDLIDLLVKLRMDLRADKQWAYSDLIRDKLAELDISLEDTPNGTLWSKE